VREVAPRALGAVARRFSDYTDSQDAVPQALIAAAAQWPTQGPPNNPVDWPIHQGRRRPREPAEAHRTTLFRVRGESEPVAPLERLLGHGYSLDGTRYPTGRPDRSVLPLRSRGGMSVVGKFYPAGGGEEAYANIQEVWRSSFGERRRPPGLPRPVEYLPDLRMLVIERLEGRPLVELTGRGRGVAADAIRLLASLHSSDAKPTRRRSADRIIRSIRRKSNRVALLAPSYAGHFRAVTEALEEHRPSDSELVPSHGDFGLRNLLLVEERLILVDWDRLQLADPARDLAFWGTAHWVRALQDGATPDWSALDRATAVYASARGGAPPRDRLRFHVAAGLMRVAHNRVELGPREAELVPRLATEALAQLQ
jgi:hypothetical protein